MKLLEGKVALITGAARGIGRAIAEEYAKQGANVAITDMAPQEAIDDVATEIAQKYGVKVVGYNSNASDFTGSQETVNQIVKEFTRLDILVNNAGITRDGLIMRMTEDQWDLVVGVNLKSAFNLIKAVTPTMMKQRSGSIINMSSVVGVTGNAGQANYAASKAGMIALAKSVAKEFGSRGIRANSIAPGFIVTEMTGALSPDVQKEWADKIPLKRGGTPEEVAKVCVFLASDLSSYVSGQTIHCCGGMTM